MRILGEFLEIGVSREIYRGLQFRHRKQLHINSILFHSTQLLVHSILQQIVLSLFFHRILKASSINLVDPFLKLARDVIPGPQQNLPEFGTQLRLPLTQCLSYIAPTILQDSSTREVHTHLILPKQYLTLFHQGRDKEMQVYK